MKYLDRNTLTITALGVSAFLVGCEAPPPETVQTGYRGLAMVQIYNHDRLQASLDANAPPAAIPAAAPGGPKAKDFYKNVQVLGELTVGEFNRLMVAMTTWVAPQQGCTYCHEGTAWELDGNYTKIVSRRMLQMTQDTNANWKDHVAQTGVTCYTCHRGNPVPAKVWVTDPGPRLPSGIAPSGQNTAAKMVAYTSLPYDPFTPFLLQDNDIRIIGDTALPTGNRRSIKQAEWTYGLMMHISDSLGVNCSFCHNSRSFMSWDQSTPQRTTAWYAIRHVRALNNDYVVPLGEVLPATRKGPLGDPYKVYCATCHQGAYKPLYGAPMVKDYPELSAPLPEGGVAALKAKAEAAAPAAQAKVEVQQAPAPAPAPTPAAQPQAAAAPAPAAPAPAPATVEPAAAAQAEPAPAAAPRPQQGQPRLRYPPPGMMQYPPAPLQYPPPPAAR
jgi:photosynthetic reaction center cytochrome c subunit